MQSTSVAPVNMSMTTINMSVVCDQVLHVALHINEVLVLCNSCHASHP